jgi:L-lactate dehydrogenase (cytochrome)
MAKLVCVADYRKAAKRRLPRAIFDFVDGGAVDELTIGENERAYDRILLRPRPLVDVNVRDMSTTVLGRKVELPVLLGPAGAQRLMCPEGELAAVRAAARAGTVYALSTGATRTIEEVAEAGQGATLWFQLYLWGGQDVVRPLIERAERSGYHALCLTVDNAGAGRKLRDARNGMSVPPRLTPSVIADVIRHPRWLRGYLFAPPIRFSNLSAGNQKFADRSVKNAGGLKLFEAPGAIEKQSSRGASWDDLRWVRSVWDGPLVVKGILSAEAARQAFDAGADAVVCSNHGGRTLDTTPATIDVLSEIVEAAAGRSKEVYVDGGVRRGTDVIKALALGARACLIARPYFWGLAVAGEEGVTDVLDLFRKELDAAMALLGRPVLTELEPSVLYERREA